MYYMNTEILSTPSTFIFYLQRAIKIMLNFDELVQFPW